uniref:Uncharacterized protein n=1 Tax=uncultured marine virus TaxID=186617 RepID=A0A0F7L5W6_9VIRU|nr:hypothetical protein Psyc_1014 [uncultured marine virus]
MALNLSTLTSPATSADVLAEVLTTADFLEPCPVLRNLSRGSNKGGDAKQDVALNQPRALPLIDGDGYLYLSGVSGNNARIADSDSLTFLNDIEIIVNFKVLDDSTWRTLVSKYQSSEKEYLLTVTNTDNVQFYRGGGGSSSFYVNFNTSYADLKPWIKATHRLSDGRCQLFFSSDGVTWNLFETLTMSAVTPSNSSTDFFIGGFGSVGQSDVCKGAIKKVIIKDGIDGTEELNIDFTATNVRHGDTKFKCATGQVVTINQAGNDPATVIKKSVLRFANTGSTNIAMKGLFANHIDSGYMFAAFSVLGNGGENYGRIFTVNKTGSGTDGSGDNGVFSSRWFQTNDLRSYYGGNLNYHAGLFDDANGDILHEVKLKSGDSSSKVNNADSQSSAVTISLDSNEFNISQNDDNARNGGENPSLDLEFLALFPASITDAQADSVRNYINNRNNVFDLKDGFGYYFYNAQSAPVGAITTGSSSWNGRIVGSDLGDSDRYLTQGTTNDAPVGDGYVVTFADNTDHLDIPQVTQAGWQVVGTSLGTFAYRVNANAVTELNLLGNLGHTAYRQTGDLYGIILLPESATGADIEAARKLLIDRGAADASTIISAGAAWFRRYDIVEFKNAEFPDALTLGFAFEEATNLSKISTVNAPLCPNFASTWKGCSALTSFPAGAKLGTSAQNVNFTSAFQSSGLTSFPADIDLSNGTVFSNAFRETDLISFPAINLQNGIEFVNTWYNCTSLSSFGNANLNGGKNFNSAWRFCTSLEDFPPLFTNWNPTSLQSTVFNNAWDFCTSLTAQSVENILTSIDASNQHGTDDGTSTGNPLYDSGIDIDYNVATGSLSAATNSAVTSLKAKGWSIIVNNVTL